MVLCCGLVCLRGGVAGLCCVEGEVEVVELRSRRERERWCGSSAWVRGVSGSVRGWCRWGADSVDVWLSR